MAFQTKSFVAIVASAINRVRRTTLLFNDFNIGSVARTLIEAWAQELDDLYQQMVRGLIDAIQVSVYNSFNFQALPSVAASGLVVVQFPSSASAVTIYAGTTFTAAGRAVTYAALNDVVVSPGETNGFVLVAATVAGASGNIPFAQSFTLAPSPQGFISASNPSPFINGADGETQDERKTRFRSYVSTLSRGTIDAVIYGALTTKITLSNGITSERVMSASLVEPYLADNTQPTGLIYVYIHNGVGNTSFLLVLLAQQIVDGYVDNATGVRVPGWKAAGVKAVVAAATDQPVNVLGILVVAPGAALSDVVAAVKAAVAQYIGTLPVGASYQASQVARIICDTPGVSNWQPIGPTVDIAVAATVKLLPGTINPIAVPLAANLQVNSTLVATLS